MPHLFEHQLAKLRDALVEMAQLAEDNLRVAVEALVQRHPAKADRVEEADSGLDEMEVHLDEMVVTYMATHAPVAQDCRLMLVVTKINANLERIGDLAVTVARQARELSREPGYPPYPDLARMGDLALAMLRDSIACFVSGEYELALEIIRRDKEVDAIKRDTIEQLLRVMTHDPSMVQRAVRLIEAARSLERIADHAKSIAQQVYYLIRAEDIRHGRKPGAGAAS